MKNKIFVFGILFLAIISVNAIKGGTEPDDPWAGYEPQNLQVLPADTPPQVIGMVMDAFNDALGVKCGHCHVRTDDGLDFVSDDNQMKEVARGMMKMTAEISEKYFKDTEIDGKRVQMSCMTCHNGQSIPVMRDAY